MIHKAEFYYIYDGSLYYFIEAIIDPSLPEESRVVKENIIHVCAQVAICFDSDDYVLLKHGNAATMHREASERRLQLMSSNLSFLANKIEVLEFPIGYDIEEINKCIDVAGYIKVFLNKASN